MIAAINPTTQPLSLRQRVDDDPLFEIIDGQYVELPPRSILASRVTSKLHGCVANYLMGKPIGETLLDALFRLPLPADRNRRPDMAVVLAETLAQTREQLGSDNAWAIVPDLMVEVVSPSDLAEEVMERINEYFAAGTKVVWIVYPTLRLIYIYDSPRQVHILGEADELDGGKVLPGFRIPIRSLFPA